MPFFEGDIHRCNGSDPHEPVPLNYELRTTN
jgi:hypothetical protein